MCDVKSSYVEESFCFYASAQHNVARGILFLSCLSVHPCVHPKTLTRYLAEYFTHFHQTYMNNAVWDRDECFTVWGQMVKSQGYDGMKYAGNSTFWTC